MNRFMESVFTCQWEDARAVGLTEAEIAVIWGKRSLKPPPRWAPPPREK